MTRSHLKIIYIAMDGHGVENCYLFRSKTLSLYVVVSFHLKLNSCNRRSKNNVCLEIVIELASTIKSNYHLNRSDHIRDHSFDSVYVLWF